MPQSLVKNYIHIVFSTKHRNPIIKKDIEQELFSYLAGTSRELESNSLIVGGHRDHVHLLVNLNRKIALMELVEKLKSHSSKWIKGKGEEYDKFYWQHGYGGFSVNPNQVDAVTDYIKNQAIHHKRNSFKTEYRIFLRKYNVDYDERYVWD